MKNGMISLRNNWKKFIKMINGLTVFVFMSVVVCQSVAAQVERGFQAANSYAAGGIDAVNTSNGNVILNIPIASLPPGRGSSPGYTVNLQYNSKLWDSLRSTRDDGVPNGEELGYYSTTTLRPSDQGGWRFFSKYALRITDRFNYETPNVCHMEDPVEHLAYRWKLEMEMPDGSIKKFFPTDQWGVAIGNWQYDGYSNVDTAGVQYQAQKLFHPSSGICYTNETTNDNFITSGMNYITMDGSRLRLFIPRYSTNWKLYYPNGTVVENDPSVSGVQQRTTDRNGNYIDYLDNGNIVDQLGRSIEFTTDGNGDTLVSVKGVGGTVVSTKIDWGGRWVHQSYKRATAMNANPAYVMHQVHNNLITVDKIAFPTQLGIQEMVFDYYGDINSPTTGNFTEGWGELKSVELPTGAKSSYLFAQDDDTAASVIGRHAERKNLEYTESYDGQSAVKTNSWLYQVSRWGNVVTHPSGGTNFGGFIL